MKPSFLLPFILFLFFSMHLPAQSNQDVENAKWINAYYELSPEPFFWNLDLKYTVKYCSGTDDTLIGGNTYIKLMNCSSGNMTYRGGLRVIGERWYFIAKDSVSEMLLYDFGLSIGDTLKEPFFTEHYFAHNAFGPLVVSQIDTTVMLGTPRRHIYFDNSSGAWIEGVGCSQGLLWDPFANISMFAIALECFSQADATRFVGSEYGGYTGGGNYNVSCDLSFSLSEDNTMNAIQIYPNPTVGGFTLAMADFTGKAGLKIYDATGKLVHLQEVVQQQIWIEPHIGKGFYTLLLENGRSLQSLSLVVR